MLISGKAVAETIQEEIRQNILSHPPSRKPGLAYIVVGDHAPSLSYVATKQRAAARVGIASKDFTLPAATSEKDLLVLISSLNQDPEIDGILVQLPLPSHIHTERITAALDPDKDVDGFHPLNMGKLLLGQEGGFVPCTPLGIQVLLERSSISPEGKHLVIVGRSAIVGKPLAALFMQKKPGCNATVTVANSRTTHLAELTRRADILVAALGVPRFIKEDMVGEGAVVIDVGINRVEGKIVGDVDFDRVAPKAKAITPVPGGVGPMTVAMLLSNTYASFLRRQ